MSEKKHNKLPGPEDFLKYRGNNLSGKERNAFERELQKDPFAAEAEEGFSTVDPGSIKGDIELLGEKLRKRTKEKSRFMIYRLAASLAIILGIASVFIITERSRKTGTTESQPEPFTIAESKPVERQKADRQETDDIILPSPAAKMEKKTDRAESKVENAPVQPQLRFAISDTLKEIIAEEEPVRQPVIAREAEALAEAVAAAPVTEAAKARTDTRRAEVSKAGGAAVAGIEAADKKSTDYSYPVPSTGQEDFEKYIRENIRLPEGFKAGERLIVELTFLVRPTGRPERIQVVKSPGKQYTDEAIRLLKEGPDWIPARRDGKIVSDTARVQIEFRKD